MYQLLSVLFSYHNVRVWTISKHTVQLVIESGNWKLKHNTCSFILYEDEKVLLHCVRWWCRYWQHYIFVRGIVHNVTNRATLERPWYPQWISNSSTNKPCFQNKCNVDIKHICRRNDDIYTSYFISALCNRKIIIIHQINWYPKDCWE